MADSGTNAPKHIYLQDGGGDEPLPADRYDEQCTWCSDAIESDDTKYIRFDLHESELAALKLELARRENYLVWAMSNMNMSEHHIGFSSHVLRRGGVGDFSDCATYIEKVEK